MHEQAHPYTKVWFIIIEMVQMSMFYSQYCPLHCSICVSQAVHHSSMHASQTAGSRPHVLRTHTPSHTASCYSPAWNLLSIHSELMWFVLLVLTRFPSISLPLLVPAPSLFLLSHFTVYLNTTGCSEPLGIKSRLIDDRQLTASSSFRTWGIEAFTWHPHYARLDKQGKTNAWTAATNDRSEWLQVRLVRL